jgi:hypothetical protein
VKFKNINDKDLDTLSSSSKSFYSANFTSKDLLPIVTNDHGNLYGRVVETHKVVKNDDKDYNGYELLGKLDSMNIILVVRLEKFMEIMLTKPNETFNAIGVFYDTTPDMTEQIDAFMKQINSTEDYYRDKYFKVLC